MQDNKKKVVMKKKSVCMVAYTNYRIDARVRREAETLAALQNYRVRVLVPRTKPLPETYELNGVEIRELNTTKYQGKSTRSYLLSYAKFMVLAFLSCNGLLMKKTLDVVHIHNMPNIIILSAIIPRLFGKKLVLDIHDTMIETYSAKFEGASSTFLFKILIRILRLEESISCAIAHKIICVNHIQKDVLVGRGIPERKIIVSINVPDPKMFPLRKKDVAQQCSNNGFKLIYHGTLAKRLGIDLTIRAIALSAAKIPGIEFHIVGFGDDAQAFIDLSRELGVQEHIKFSDAVPVQEVAAIVEKMDLGVISNRDNIAAELMLPVKMLEYVALELPVVVPRLKTIQYYFSDDMVFYFEPDNVQSLFQTILYAYHNDAMRREKAVRAKKFLDLYGWESHKNGFIDMYEMLLR
jgi:glycosyltransferase involved in cell wall biosynthesis